MAFTFLHTADWQIGKRFGSLPPDKAGLLREARFTAIDRLAEAARTHGLRHVLVAGDVFESETSERQTRRRPFEQMRAQSGLRWHLLPGNHDPARPGGLWDVCLKEGLPANVSVHVELKAQEIEPGVWLLPAPLTARSAGSDPTAWFASAALPPGAIAIGLAHGEAHGFAGDSGRLIDVPRAVAKLSYLALGDWHGLKQVNPRAWYSGTPEPDRFKDNEPGFALIVRLDGPEAPPRVERLATARYRWRALEAHLTAPEDMEALEARMLTLHPDPFSLLVKLDLDGLVSLHQRSGIEGRVKRLEDRFFHVEAELDRLELRPDLADLDRIDRTGEVRRAAERLLALARDDRNPERELAEGALARLYALTAGDAP